MKDIESVIANWSKKNSINGKSFDDLFSLEGNPLWWFYDRFFVAHVMPKPINTFNLIKKKKISMINKIKLSISAEILKKYLSLIENLKINHMKKINQTSKEKKVLFLTYSNHLTPGNKIFRLQKTIEKIKKDKKIKEFVLFVDPLSSRNYRVLSKHNNVYSYFDEEIDKKAKIIANRFYKKFKKIDNKTKYNMSKTDSFSLWPYLKYSFNFFFSQEFLYLLVLYYEIFKKILKNENIRTIVLTGQNGLFEKCILAAAKYLNVPALYIPHGDPGSDNEDLTYFKKICVNSKIYQKRLIKKGLDKNLLSVTGPAIYDDIAKYINVKKKYDKKNILIAASPFVEDLIMDKNTYFSRFEKILKDLKQLGNIRLIIKLHPRGLYKKEYRSLLKKYNFTDTEILRHITRDEFYTLITECDVFVNFGSFAAIEAMIINKPIVTIDIFGRNKNPLIGNNPIIDEKATKYIGYEEDVKKTIEEATKEDTKFENKRKKFIEKFCYKVDGKVYERVANIIYNLM